MFTNFEYSIFNFDSPFYQNGSEVSKRPTSGKKTKVTNKNSEVKEKFSLSKLFLRPKFA